MVLQSGDGGGRERGPKILWVSRHETHTGLRDRGQKMGGLAICAVGGGKDDPGGMACRCVPKEFGLKTGKRVERGEIHRRGEE